LLRLITDACASILGDAGRRQRPRMTTFLSFQR